MLKKLMKFNFVPLTFLRNFFFQDQNQDEHSEIQYQKVMLYMLTIPIEFVVAPQSFCQNSTLLSHHLFRK